jgi:hypothetical protein
LRATTTRVTLLYVALTLLFAYPLSFAPADHVLSPSSDTRLWMWTLEWDSHAFLHQPFSIFDANIFYPQRGTLAYSENLIGSAFFAAPVLWTTGNPVLALNVVALLSCVLCALGAWLLARRLGIGEAGAVLCGLIFAFSPPRFLRIGQFHLTTIQWVPFSLAFLHAYLDDGRRRDLRLAIGFFTLQALTSGHGAIFLLVAIVCLLACRLALGEPIRPLRRIRDVGLPGLLLIAPVFFLLHAYRIAQVGAGLRRTLADSLPFTAVPASFLASPSHVNAWLLNLTGHSAINAEANAYLFPGYLPLLLALAAWLPWRWGRRQAADRGAVAVKHRGAVAVKWIGAFLDGAALVLLGAGLCAALAGPFAIAVHGVRLLSVRQTWRIWMWCGLVVALRLALLRRLPLDLAGRCRRRLEDVRAWRARHRLDHRAFYTLLAVVSVWFCLGPPFGLWSFVYWLPGFNFIRVSSRFILLAVLGLAVVAGIGFDRLTRRLTPASRTFVALVAGALLVVEFAVFPLRADAYRVDVPPIDRWLATLPGSFAIAEVPEGDPHNAVPWDRRESIYMLHSTAHWQKTVHGYSGIDRPPDLTRLYTEMGNFPDGPSLRHLARLQVRYVVVHTNLYAPEEWAQVERRIEAHAGWLTLERLEGAGRVYALHAPRQGPD